MPSITFQVQSREHGRRVVRQGRKIGMVPSVIYGSGVDNEFLFVDSLRLQKLTKKVGESTIIDLLIGDRPGIPVLLGEIQRDSVTEHILHVDFRAIRMDEELETEIALRFVGESKAVKTLGGVLMKNLETLRVKCFPRFLVDTIDVPISRLEGLGMNITVKDLLLPEGVKPLHQQSDIVVSVLRVEEEKPELVAESAQAQPERIGEEEGKEKEGKEKEAVKTSRENE